jgi:C-terminal processing protease CtpA/Prc
LGLNGHPIAEVVSTFLRYLPGDGYSDGRRRSNLEYPDVFGGLYALEYGETEKYVYRLRSADGRERVHEVAGLTLEELEKRMDSLRPRPEGPLLSFRFEGEVAVLTVRSFGGRSLSADGLNYPEFLIQAFQALREKKTESLIIDVRDNGGGNDEYGQLLYAHLAPAPFKYYDRLQMNKEKSEFLRRTSDPDTGRRLPPLRQDEKGRWVRTDHPNLGIKQPRETVFSGRVYVLMNGRSFSATGEFMTAVFANKRGVFIGEESGAGIGGNTSGIMVGLLLDKSGITVSIPMVGYYMAGDHGPHPQRGILPDHEMIPTVEDILAGRDPVMEFALELARRPGL